MEIFIEKNYDELCRKVAIEIEAYCKRLKEPLFCPASGDTPRGVYECMVMDGKNGYDFDNWIFVGLDEWLGFNSMDDGSCHADLNRQIFDPLNISEDNICFFNGRAEDPASECSRIENFIEINGGIDIALLGIGLNGHVGMNEPGTSPKLSAHVVELHPSTISTAQKYFKAETKLSKGITLGIGSLLKAKKIFIMVSGLHKAEILASILTSETTTGLPATLLKEHPDLTYWLDADAASRLAGGY